VQAELLHLQQDGIDVTPFAVEHVTGHGQLAHAHQVHKRLWRQSPGAQSGVDRTAVAARFDHGQQLRHRTENTADELIECLLRCRLRRAQRRHLCQQGGQQRLPRLQQVEGRIAGAGRAQVLRDQQIRVDDGLRRVHR
jgi:hypothetical protein